MLGLGAWAVGCSGFRSSIYGSSKLSLPCAKRMKVGEDTGRSSRSLATPKRCKEARVGLPKNRRFFFQALQGSGLIPS